MHPPLGVHWRTGTALLLGVAKVAGGEPGQRRGDGVGTLRLFDSRTRQPRRLPSALAFGMLTTVDEEGS